MLKKRLQRDRERFLAKKVKRIDPIDPDSAPFEKLTTAYRAAVKLGTKLTMDYKRALQHGSAQAQALLGKLEEQKAVIEAARDALTKAVRDNASEVKGRLGLVD